MSTTKCTFKKIKTISRVLLYCKFYRNVRSAYILTLIHKFLGKQNIFYVNHLL